jgi:hypothetical protein
VRVESPGAFDAADITVPTGGGENYSTFHIDLTDVTLSSSDDLMVLVSAFCEDEGFQDFLPGKTTAAYNLHYAEVYDHPPGPAPTAVADSIPKIGFINFAGDFYGNNSTGTITLYQWDFNGDGSYEWSNPSTGNTTHAYTAENIYNATLKVSNGPVFDTDSVEIRMIDPLPIITNGNFWNGTYDNWTISEGGVGIVKHELIDDPTFKRYVRILRTNSGNDGGGTRFLQTLNKDVTGYSKLYFNAFFRIINQSLPGDGYWATYGGWGNEFPFCFFIFYLNQNDEARFICYGYLASASDGQWEWDKSQFTTAHPGCAYHEHVASIPTNVWQEKKTIDMKTLGVDSPKFIQEIWIWSAGWDYEAHWILPWFSDH